MTTSESVAQPATLTAAVPATLPHYTSAQVLALRGPREPVDARRANASFLEHERTRDARIELVATLLLANHECPFRCTFCDLWKHTLTEPTPAGAVPLQIDAALEQLTPLASEPIRHIKLYNSGNFFDAQAIPPEDFPAIAQRASAFRTTIVENHPRLTNDRALQFRDLLQQAHARLGTEQSATPPRLEVALGLETIHTGYLAWTNKQLTVEEWQRAARFLVTHDCDVRTFLIHRFPGQTLAEATDWTVKSAEVAFEAGATLCSVIPLRAGNGLIDQLQSTGWYAPSTLESLYQCQVRMLQLGAGRVQVDLWDLESLASCAGCAPHQVDCFRQMNLQQVVREWPTCHCPE